MTADPPVVFIRKAVADLSDISSAENTLSQLWVSTSQRYPFRMCQEVPIRLNIKWESDSDSQLVDT